MPKICHEKNPLERVRAGMVETCEGTHGLTLREDPGFGGKCRTGANFGRFSKLDLGHLV